MSETSSGWTAAARASAASRSVPRATNSSQVPSSFSIGTRTMCAQFRQGVAVEVEAALSAPRNSAGREQQRRAGAGQDVGGLAGGVAGVQRHEHAAGVGAWPGTRPPSARCSATRSRPGPRRRRPGRSSPRRPARTSSRNSAKVSRVPADRGPPSTSASWSENWSAIRSRTCGMVLGSSPALRPWAHVIDAPLTKQVLGRLAYKSDRGPGVPGRGPRLARRQPRRRVRRAQGPRRAGREDEAFEERRAWNQHLAAAG